MGFRDLFGGPALHIGSGAIASNISMRWLRHAGERGRVLYHPATELRVLRGKAHGVVIAPTHQDSQNMVRWSSSWPFHLIFTGSGADRRPLA